MNDYEWATYDAKNYCEIGSTLFFAIAASVVEKVKARAERAGASPTKHTQYDQIIRC
jgi:hypothetical protein